MLSITVQPSPDADAPALENLRNLGPLPSQGFATINVGFIDRNFLNIAMKVIHDAINEALATGRVLENGWAVARDTIGNYDIQYRVRT